MLHLVENIKRPEEHLQSLFKLFSMFDTMIWYDNIIGNEDVAEALLDA